MLYTCMSKSPKSPNAHKSLIKKAPRAIASDLEDEQGDESGGAATDIRFNPYWDNQSDIQMQILEAQLLEEVTAGDAESDTESDFGQNSAQAENLNFSIEMKQLWQELSKEVSLESRLELLQEYKSSPSELKAQVQSRLKRQKRLRDEMLGRRRQRGPNG